MIKTFGSPQRNDRGKSFTSKDFQNCCKEVWSVHYLIAVALPRSNGQVEQYNRIIIDSLATMGANKNEKSWENVYRIQIGLNSTLNKAMGVSPSETLMVYRILSQGQMVPLG